MHINASLKIFLFILLVYDDYYLNNVLLLFPLSLQLTSMVNKKLTDEKEFYSCCYSLWKTLALAGVIQPAEHLDCHTPYSDSYFIPSFILLAVQYTSLVKKDFKKHGLVEIWGEKAWFHKCFFSYCNKSLITGAAVFRGNMQRWTLHLWVFMVWQVGLCYRQLKKYRMLKV